jgi:hypothetical protein
MPKSQPATCTAVCDLNLRRGAGTTFPVITTLAPGTRLTILEDAGVWLRVSAGTQEGFVSRKFVRLPAQQLPDGFLIHRPEVQKWPLAPARQVIATPGAAAATRTVAAIWNSFGGLLEPLADVIGIDPAAAVAVVAVESGGSGFKDRRMIIRFESHYFWRLWGKDNKGAFDTYFCFNRAKPWTGQRYRAASGEPWRDFHGNQAAEWEVFTQACSLDAGAAESAISMGLPQIMGANHGMIGYETTGEMFSAFSRDERAQLIGLFDFIKGPHSVSPAVNALQSREFSAFAACYNGSGQAVAYGANLQRYHEAFVALHV